MWVIASVATRQEFKTEGILRKHGVLSYCPRAFRLTKPSRKRQPIKKMEPAFPGYLFINLSTVQNFELFNHVPHFFNFLRYGEDIILFSEEEMDIVRRAAREGIYDADPLPPPVIRFYINDAVKITVGPFEGREGTVQKTRGAVAIVTLDGSSMNVTVKSCFLSKKAIPS